MKKAFISLHTKFYRPASALAHGQAPLNFAIKDGNDMKIGTRLSDPQIRICIQTACILTLFSIRSLNKLLEINQDAAVLKIEEKFSGLMELVKKGHTAEVEDEKSTTPT